MNSIEVIKENDQSNLKALLELGICELPLLNRKFKRGFLLQRRAKLDEIKLNSLLHKRQFGLSRAFSEIIERLIASI
jgi:hypothetical protein